ncbi:outer membrane protein with beta-barrel domain [Flavobacterium tiangeerense]|uniref:Outer membrane protein with beta-barrel domain n=1 Tax=Flavobacterium tiangeerense TaxID=459471 RepID=A0ABY3FK68_9FLAO|nr:MULTISPECIES: porin family protein [Flavobacterium]QZK90297.1 PorT family protein [Flavobacterium sp. CHNK8]TWI00403.1 outer membrane protein with beta-barrel domain [Flavobacterium tiangeerense]
MKKSKKLIFASITLGLLSFTGIQAQEKTPAFGFKGGLNFSNLYTDTVDDNNVLTGFNAGLYAKFPITNSIAIQPEISYTTKGSELVYNSFGVNGTAKFNINYIEVPILLVANLTDNFNVQVGPYLAYMVSGKTTNDSNLGSSVRTLNTDDFNKFDAGISGGLGFDLDAVNFGVRYNYGLTKIGKDDSFTSSDAKNSVFSAYVGLRLN